MSDDFRETLTPLKSNLAVCTQVTLPPIVRSSCKIWKTQLYSKKNLTNCTQSVQFGLLIAQRNQSSTLSWFYHNIQVMMVRRWPAQYFHMALYIVSLLRANRVSAGITITRDSLTSIKGGSSTNSKRLCILKWVFQVWISFLLNLRSTPFELFHGQDRLKGRSSSKYSQHNDFI